MGADVSAAANGSIDEFRQRLRHNLAAARILLERPGFGVGEATIGAELELSLINGEGKAAMVNRRVLEALADPRMTVELDRFNLEYNADPVPLAGRPFAAIGDQLEEALARIDAAAGAWGACAIAIGTIPSLDLEVLSGANAGHEVMTDLPRYRALEVALRSFRRSPFELDINGEDPLTARCDGVTLEGANTSLQIHLRVPPDRFADTYNAAQLATPVALAVSGNSPLFCGHRLWDETRIAVFKQAVDIRADRDPLRPPRVCFGHGWTRAGIYELLAEAVHLHEPLLPRIDDDGANCVAIASAGGVPALRELRLHLGTIWRWNRPVLDTSGEGHLRIELRALPSGPTVLDMMASSAFYLGLTLGLRDRIGELISAVPFEFVRKSFYRAAQHGLDAELAWPALSAPSPEYIGVPQLVRRLLPVARQALVDAGVEDSHVDALLAVVDERVRSRRTGARWQRAALEAMTGVEGASREEILAKLTLRYREHAETGAAVHTWPVP